MCDVNRLLIGRVSVLHSVVASSISSGRDHGIHCWWDQIRSKQLSIGSICRVQVFAGFSGQFTNQNIFATRTPLWARTEVCHQIFGGCKSVWEIYRRMCDVYGDTCLREEIFTNGLNMGWAWVEKKTFHQVETHSVFSKEKVLGAVVCKKGQDNSLLWHESLYWCLWQRYNCKQCFEWTSYIYIYIYIYWAVQKLKVIIDLELYLFYQSHIYI